MRYNVNTFSRMAFESDFNEIGSISEGTLIKYVLIIVVNLKLRLKLMVYLKISHQDMHSN